MQGVVDAAAFDHQEVAVAVFRQQVDGLDGHFRQARLGRAFAQRRRGGAVQLIFQVAAGAVQADELLAAWRRRHFRFRRGHGVALGGKFRQQVAAVGAAVLVTGRPWREVVAAATHQHVDAVAQGRVVACAAGRRLRGDRVLRIAVADVREGRRRRGVRQFRGGDGAHGLALGFRQFQNGRRALAAGRAVVDAQVAVGIAAGFLGDGILRHRDDFIVHLDAGHVGGHRWRAVRRLRIVRERLDARRALQRVHRQAAVFLVLVDARGRHDGRAHAVAEEEDDVLGVGGVGAVGNAGGHERGQQRQFQGGFQCWFHVLVQFLSLGDYRPPAVLTRPNTLVLSMVPRKVSEPLPMAPRKTSVPPWVSLPAVVRITASWW
ncbi:hypothetical protein D3C81_985260 [compost metagenome]